MLVSGLDSEDWYTRWEACLALKRIGPGARAAVAKLVGKLCDRKSDISREAALALLQIAPEDPDVADALLKALDSKYPVDRSAVRYALREIGVPAPSEPPRRRDHSQDEDEVEEETAVGTGSGWLTPSVTRAALEEQRKRMLQALLEAGAGELGRILRRRHDDYFGFLPAGHTPREREVYRLLRGRLERSALDAQTVRALGEAVWRPREVGHALLKYGGAEARAFAAALLGDIEFDYYRACEALRRAGLDPAEEVRAAARAARERIDAGR